MTDPTSSTQHLTTPDGSKCRSCGAPIEWVQINGKLCPINPEPNGDGNIVLIPAPGRRTHDARVLSKADRLARIRSGDMYGPDGGPGLYTSHFATCPQANAWRKR